MGDDAAFTTLCSSSLTLLAMHPCDEVQVAVNKNSVTRMRLPCLAECKNVSHTANVSNVKAFTKKAEKR